MLRFLYTSGLLFLLSTSNAQLSDEIKSFTDKFFNDNIEKIAALGICIVQDTSVLYQAGYGVTDFDQKGHHPVSPDKTIFGAASVGKLFVATAVMQLVEQNRVNLNDDIRKYIPGLILNKAKDKVVSVKNLLTHTGGLEDGMIGVVYHQGESPISLNDYFSNHPPNIVFEPGFEMAYSNRGMALAGLLVEAVTGMPFYQYVENEIFSPLEMKHSSFRQPLPDSLSAKGLRYLPDLDNEFLIPYPSGSLFTSVADMGKFMIVHLNGGSFQEKRILNASTVALMHETHFSPYEGMPFMAIGFMQAVKDGHAILYHSGARYFNSLLVLIPDVKLGIYISLNGNGSLRKAFLEAFMEKFVPAKSESTAWSNQQTSTDSHAKFIGTYRLNIGSRTTIEKLFSMVMQAKVSYDGHLVIKPIGLNAITLSNLADGLYEGADGAFYFFNSHNGTNTLFRSNALWDDPMSFTEIAWYENGILHAIGLALSSSFVAFMFLYWSIKLVRKKFYFNEKNKIVKLASLNGYLSTLLFICPAILVIGFVVAGNYADHVKSNLTLLFTFTSVSLVFGILNIPILFLMIYNKIGTRSLVFQMAGISMAFLVWLLIGNYYNLVGYHF